MHGRLRVMRIPGMSCVHHMGPQHVVGAEKGKRFCWPPGQGEELGYYAAQTAALASPCWHAAPGPGSLGRLATRQRGAARKVCQAQPRRPARGTQPGLASGCASESSLKRLTPSPPSSAARLATSGGSWLWSPTSTKERLFSSGPAGRRRAGHGNVDAVDVHLRC